MRLRVMTYNILLGGQGPRGLDRTDALCEVIASAAPDIVALQECSGFYPEERDALRAFETRLGMKGVLGRCGSKLHLSVLARPGIELRVVCQTGRPVMRHGGLHVAARAGDLALELVTVHLNPFVEDARLDELVHLTPGLPQGHALMLGDFNGLSPRDTYSAADIAAFLPQYRVTPPSKSLGEVVPDHPQTRALAHALAHGWVDLGHAVPGAERPCTYPTPGAPDPEGPPIRIDYVLARPALAAYARAYRTIRGGVADTASDHYPVVVEFDIPENENPA